MAYETIISAATLAGNLDDGDWAVFDCRFSLSDGNAGAKAYRMGHIPGSRYANLNLDLSSPVKKHTGRHPLPNFAELEKKLGEWGVGNRTQVVIYDDAGGAFAGRMWWLLRCMGHQQAAVLDGGIQEWRREGFQLTTALPKYAPKQFRSYLDIRECLNASQVESGLASRRITLIDARTPERFVGRMEPIDPIAGHIPKALNRPFQLNLDKNARFLSAELLCSQFQQLTDSAPSEQVVHMCGSGVTACHNLLAMEIAGLTGSKLYAGSWSEWIVNRNRPVLRGGA